ncbi:type II toxin-antitoxin system Phd/YefM family antitoxin [Thiocapsa sp. UBA6158]|jgi:antitoxin (DNA-binding transcriptional repressor) of toxin-antitoxin stability system|uniref:type II toxin-antitoxin system Phd/YefM family antitoxin n=1 Tax=Thiocapsa sp. UBA6158 TaxID=1947692 RepID=UPI0025E22CC4|nr:type II toxin-antitoxin system prevent-host-death family antitoxin [Thiocapsa sp. UBA6158]
MARFSEVVEQASRGQDVIITSMGKRVVRMTRHESAPPNQCFGLLRGQLRIVDDCDTWPEEIARDLGMVD